MGFTWEPESIRCVRGVIRRTGLRVIVRILIHLVRADQMPRQRLAVGFSREVVFNHVKWTIQGSPILLQIFPYVAKIGHH